VRKVVCLALSAEPGRQRLNSVGCRRLQESGGARLPTVGDGLMLLCLSPLAEAERVWQTLEELIPLEPSQYEELINAPLSCVRALPQGAMQIRFDHLWTFRDYVMSVAVDFRGTAKRRT
jgi:hypothetical protein